MRGRAAGGGSSSPLRADVDFRLARRRIEALTHYPPVRRARALAAYVAAFDLADADGRVDLPTSRIAAEFEIGVVSWLHLREVLEEAGLVAVDPHRGGVYAKLDGETDPLALSLRLAMTPCGPLYKRHGSPDRELAALVSSAPH